MSEHLKFQLEPDDQERLNRLCGPTNSTLKQIEKILRIKISNRGMKFKVRGETDVIKTAEFLLKDLYERLEKNIIMSPEEIDLYLRQAINNNTNIEPLIDFNRNTINVIKTPKISVNPKGLNQEKYLEFIEKKNFNYRNRPCRHWENLSSSSNSCSGTYKWKSRKVVAYPSSLGSR